MHTSGLQHPLPNGEGVDPTGVYVLGMHRSGTSAATRVVNLLGVPTTGNEGLLPPAPLNPTGFWESAALNDVNDEILCRFGGDSANPPRLSPGWEFDPGLGDLPVRADRCFLRTFTTAQWVWKDPRNCLTFPFWRRVTRAKPVALIVYRNPLEVAASLLAHHAVPKSAALPLWERYVSDSLTHARGLPTYVVGYADIISAPAAAAAKLHRFLSRRGLQLSALDTVTDRVSCFIRADLRHYQVDPEDLARDQGLTASQRQLFTWLERCRGAHSCLPTGPPGFGSSGESTVDETQPTTCQDAVTTSPRSDR